MAELGINIPGESAYQMWLAQGNSGSKQDFLSSLQGKTPVKGTDYDDGKSAYQSAVDNGFVGTEAVWLASLQGLDGQSAYQSAVSGGFTGTETEWIASLKGVKGDNGNTPQFVEITQANYNLLTETEKNNPLKVYVIPSAAS